MDNLITTHSSINLSNDYRGQSFRMWPHKQPTFHTWLLCAINFPQTAEFKLVKLICIYKMHIHVYSFSFGCET